MHNIELSPLDSFSSPSVFQESVLGAENFVATPSSASSLDHIAPAVDAQHAALQALISPVLGTELTILPSFRNCGNSQSYLPHTLADYSSSLHRHNVRLSDSPSSRLPRFLDQYDLNTLTPTHYVPVIPFTSFLSGSASGTNPSYGSPPQSIQPIPSSSSQYLSTHQPTDLGDLSTSQQIEFDTICSDYLTMLSSPTRTDSTNKAEATSPALRASSPPEDEAAAKAILEVLEGTIVVALSRTILSSESPPASPSYKVEHELSAYLTSPLIDSPWEEDFLTTPALLPGGDMGIDIMTSPALLDNDEVYTSAPLFGDEPLFEPLTFEKLNADRRGPSLDSLSLKPSSEAPESPTTFISQVSSTGGSSKKSAGKQATKTARRKSVPTGTRKNVTPDSLIPVDAPIQTRKYVSESVTSRKELPAVFARKRKRASADLDDEEDLLAAPPTTNELSAIEAKRRQNTLAARRSRKRKLEHQRELESIIDNERAEKDAWKQRALAFEAILNSNGIRIPPEFAIQRM